MTPPPAVDLSAIRARLDAASLSTKGWVALPTGTPAPLWCVEDCPEDGEDRAPMLIADCLLQADAHFIARAPTDVAALLGVVEELREAVGTFLAFYGDLDRKAGHASYHMVSIERL